MCDEGRVGFFNFLAAAVTVGNTDRFHAELFGSVNVEFSVADHDTVVGIIHARLFKGIGDNLVFICALFVHGSAANSRKATVDFVMLHKLFGKKFGFRGRHDDLNSAVLKPAQQLGDSVVQHTFKNAFIAVIFAVISYRSQGAAVGKAVVFCERVNKRRPYKGGKLVFVGFFNSELFKGIDNRVCDSLKRVGNGTVKVEQHKFIFHI